MNIPVNFFYTTDEALYAVYKINNRVFSTLDKVVEVYPTDDALILECRNASTGNLIKELTIPMTDGTDEDFEGLYYTTDTDLYTMILKSFIFAR